MSEQRQVWTNCARGVRHAVFGSSQYTVCQKALYEGYWEIEAGYQDLENVDCRQCRARQAFKVAMKEAKA